MRTGATSAELFMLLVGPHTETAPTVFLPSPIAAATQETPTVVSSRSCAMLCSRIRASSTRSRAASPMEFGVGPTTGCGMTDSASIRELASSALPIAVRWAGWRPPTRDGTDSVKRQPIA